MNRFRYARAESVAEAVRTVSRSDGARFIAGGTNILDLMKDAVEAPPLLVDVTALPLADVRPRGDGIWIGALARMSDVADAAAVQRAFPAIAQALLDSASPQLRNMATIGGNLVQRTRCAYFRDASVPCNKRAPGTGCPALAGVNRAHAILGGSDRCICVHASDLAVALAAFDARVHTEGPAGERIVPIGEFYLLPGTTPERETVLVPGELIVGVELPPSAAARRSRYLKVRDRASYEFALVSVAAGLDLDGGVVRDVRIALGGVAPIPWRAAGAERVLHGSRLDGAAIEAASHAAVAGARGAGLNDFKVELARRCVARALHDLGGTA